MQSLPQVLEPFSAYRQFLLYKIVPQGDKLQKFPCNNAGQVVDAHDPAHWMTATDAFQWAARTGLEVAFVFTDRDPFWFLDVDACLIPEDEETGAPATWNSTAQMLLAMFPGAAVEVSASGRGLHLFGRGTVPPGRRRKKGPGFDLYTELRFVALTGTHASGSADTDHSAALDQLVTLYLQPDPNERADGWTTEPRADWAGPSDDDELLAKALKSRSAAAAFGSKASVADLFNANEDALALHFPPDQGCDGWDQSRVDMALAQHLAWWTGCDCERIKRLMERSALARDKWTDRPEYLERTIELACNRQTEVMCNVPAPEDRAAPVLSEAMEPTLVDGQPFMAPSDQVGLFAGCVYVADRHKVLTPRGLLDQGRFNAVYGGWSFSLTADNQKTTRKAWDAFTESMIMRFPKVESTCFRPELGYLHVVTEGSVRRVNTYRDIETPRVQGDPGPMLGLLAKMLPVERDRRILITYMAACVQHKGVKFQWWPVIAGAKGNGKTLLLTAMRVALGEQYCFAPNVSDIAKGNKFNGWIDGKLFIAMEEVYVADRRTFLEEFKTTVTNEWLPVEAKGVDQAMMDNRANGIMATNHRNGVPVDADERRYCVLYTAQQAGPKAALELARDGMTGDYFPDLYDWCKGRNKYAHLGTNYGFAVWHDFLATYPLDPEFNPAAGCQVAPKTSSTAIAVRESLGKVEQQVLEAIDQGRIGFMGGWVSSVFLDKLLGEIRGGDSIPQTQRRDLMQRLGYDWHPGLRDGRVNNQVLPDASKPRLYVKLDGPLAHMEGGAVIAKAYTDAQLTPPSS